MNLDKLRGGTVLHLNTDPEAFAKFEAWRQAAHDARARTVAFAAKVGAKPEFFVDNWGPTAFIFAEDLPKGWVRVKVNGAYGRFWEGRYGKPSAHQKIAVQDREVWDSLCAPSRESFMAEIGALLKSHGVIREEGGRLFSYRTPSLYSPDEKNYYLVYYGFMVPYIPDDLLPNCARIDPADFAALYVGSSPPVGEGE